MNEISDVIEDNLWKHLRMEKVASGFDFMNKVRDLTFADKNGEEYEITIKKILTKEITT